MAEAYAWWQTGVIYQVYPRSFFDSNNDGVGDIPGITRKLDYFSWLGVDALWLSPIFLSPMADFGYDISDYCAVHPLFGTLEDLDTLVHAAHQRDLKIILDYVPNHTSDEHPWFQEARSNRTNAKRDWYIWRDQAHDGGPPNNWVSQFGGRAWEFDALSGQYYLHLYDAKQPDLNWRNPEVRKAMYDVLRFWLDRGIDGFRVDALQGVVKDDLFRDNPPNPTWQTGDPPYLAQIGRYTENQPGLHEITQEMRAVVDGYKQRMLIGEIYLPMEQLVSYYGEQLDEIHLPFNFQFVTMRTWEAQAVRQIVDAYEAMLPPGAWPNWVLGNHDRTRIATRIGREQARIAQMLLLTLRGTPTCYYGEELNMQDVPVPLALIRDPMGKENPEHSRDLVRTPMQWDGSAHAGFCAAEVQPWLPVADDYQLFNVAAEKEDTRSMLTLTRTLLHLRRTQAALTIGDYRSLAIENESCFAYMRHYQEQRYLVVLNFSAREQVVQLSGQAQIVLSTHGDRTGSVDLSALHLRGNEGLLLAHLPDH